MHSVLVIKIVVWSESVPVSGLRGGAPAPSSPPRSADGFVGTHLLTHHCQQLSCLPVSAGRLTKRLTVPLGVGLLEKECGRASRKSPFRAHARDLHGVFGLSKLRTGLP